jgi:hypothetical protein
MAELLGWDEESRQKQIADYQEELGWSQEWKGQPSTVTEARSTVTTA